MTTSRRRRPAMVPLIGLALAATVTPAGAQEILSDPAGARVAIEGDVSVRGVTPLPIDTLPPGSYRMTVRGYRMPRTQGRLRRAMDGSVRTGSLNGAGVGLLPPGAAHLRQEGERWRGTFLLAGGVVGGTGLIVNQGRIGQLEDDQRVAQDLYDRAVSEEAILEARLALTGVSQELEDAREMRNLWGVFTGALWVGSWLEAWALTPTPQLRSTGDGNYRMTNGPATRGGAFLRSALLPGGGQRYLGQYGRANRFLVGVTGFGIGALFAHDEYLQRRREQFQTQERFLAATDREEIESLRSELEERHDRTRDMELVQWTLTGLAAGIYVWNLIDALTLIEETGTPNTFSLRLLPDVRGGVVAGVRWRIG